MSTKKFIIALVVMIVLLVALAFAIQVESHVCNRYEHLKICAQDDVQTD